MNWSILTGIIIFVVLIICMGLHGDDSPGP